MYNFKLKHNILHVATACKIINDFCFPKSVFIHICSYCALTESECETKRLEIDILMRNERIEGGTSWIKV